MDYAQSKIEAIQERERLLQRKQAIADEKSRLDRENGEIERQLYGLEQIVEGFEFLSSDIPPELEKPGFTEQIRRILQQTIAPLTAVEIRDELLAGGVEHSSAKNLLISVHTVLGRLESDLKKSEKGGKSAYAWKHTVRRRHHFPSGRPGTAVPFSPAPLDPVPGAIATPSSYNSWPAAPLIAPPLATVAVPGELTKKK